MTGSDQGLTRILKWVLLGCGLYYIVVYLSIAFLRISYPHHLEWVEGAHVDEIVRILKGQTVYVRPSIEFVPLFYTPFYFYVGAAFSKLFGVGFFSLRLLSIISSLGTMAAIFALVKHETKSSFFAFLGACFFAACYKISAAWYDLGRVDALFICLVFWALTFSRKSQEWKTSALAGCIAFLAFFTKQSGLMLFVPLCVYFVLFEFKSKKFSFSIVFVGLVLLTKIIYDAITDGWYSYYVFELIQKHSAFILTERFKTFWTEDILKVILIAFIFSVTYLVASLLKFRQRGFWLFVWAGVFLTSFFSRLHHGGSENVLIPLYACVGILFAVAAHDLSEFCHKKLGASGKFLVLLMVLVQFISLGYTTKRQIPSKDDVATGDRLMAAMKNAPGDLLAPRYGYFPLLAGKKTHAHKAPMDDIILVDPIIGQELKQSLITAIKNHEFGSIIFESEIFGPAIKEYYYPATPIILKNSKFWSEKDAKYVYIPKAK